VHGYDADARSWALEFYAGSLKQPVSVDPNLRPGVIAVLAQAGEAGRYDEFLAAFRSAKTPQDEQRYLYALAGFRDPALLRQTLERTINGEIRTQDAPFVVRSMLLSVYARELTWDFVKRQWDTMDRLYPKHAMRRLAEGVTGLVTHELEADVHTFFAAKNPQFGGKVLAQYLEQLHVAVTLREREGAALSAYVATPS
jgi:puromycin-sensitive aminopeptidase